MDNAIVKLDDARSRYASVLDFLRTGRSTRRTPEPWALGPNQRIWQSALFGHPLPLVVEWGIGPNRPKIEAPEEAALQHLRFIASTLESTLSVSCTCTILLADTIASINGVAEDEQTAYTASLMRHSASYEVGVAALSTMLVQYGRTGWLGDAESLAETGEMWDGLAGGVQKQLVEQATRVARGDPGAAARAYLAMAWLQSPLVAHVHADALQLSYHPPEMSFLLPALPTLHIYVDESRNLKRPWFLNAATCGGQEI